MYIHMVDWFREPFLHVLIHCFCIDVFISSVCAQKWTEADESKRLADLKIEERRYFERQFGMRLPPERPFAEASLDYNMATSLSASDPNQPSNHRQYHHQHRHHSEQHHRLTNDKTHGNYTASLHWCFHCISPWTSVTSSMRQVVLNLLDLRRAAAPSSTSVVSDCTQPRDVNRLQRHQCRHSYCQTLVLTDHENGAAFTLRGCAEHYGAIDEKILESREDNICKRLHNHVDIRECICRHRRYCYTGDDRNLDYSAEADDFKEMIRSAKFQRHVQNGARVLFNFNLGILSFFFLIYIHMFI